MWDCGSVTIRWLSKGGASRVEFHFMCYTNVEGNENWRRRKKNEQKVLEGMLETVES